MNKKTFCDKTKDSFKEISIQNREKYEYGKF